MTGSANHGLTREGNPGRPLHAGAFFFVVLFQKMAFVDELKVYIKAGDGGDGVVRWLHEKGKEFGGPAGGNGGRGGSVFIRGARDIHMLARYKNQKEFAAGRGQNGMSRSKNGKDGEDLVIDMPVGAVLVNQSTGETFELVEEDQKIQILAGGRGGRGNETFKSSTNRNPKQSTPGGKGEGADFFIELRLFADAGFIGVPNAGKSSLLNALTRAKAAVAAYPFTTLEPNLGELYGFILADIPGLIEGASTGKGLGHKFLRHIRRTRALVHVISLEHENVGGVYNTIRDELEKYDKTLLKKPEIIVLSKVDAGSPGAAEEAKRLFSKTHDHVFVVSVLDDALIKNFRDELITILKKFPVA